MEFCRVLSRLGRALGPARIAPVHPLQETAELGRRDLNRFAAAAARPNELPGLQPLDIERHAHAVVPERLDQVALAAAQAEDLPGMWIAPEPLLDRHAARHEHAGAGGPPAGNPHAPPRREGDHLPSRIGSSRANASGSTEDGTSRRRPLLRTISSWTSGAGRRNDWVSKSGAIFTGTKKGPLAFASSPSRYCRRQTVSSERQMPCRRAVAETCRCPPRLSRPP